MLKIASTISSPTLCIEVIHVRVLSGLHRQLLMSCGVFVCARRPPLWYLIKVIRRWPVQLQVSRKWSWQTRWHHERLPHVVLCATNGRTEKLQYNFNLVACKDDKPTESQNAGIDENHKDISQTYHAIHSSIRARILIPKMRRELTHAFMVPQGMSFRTYAYSLGADKIWGWCHSNL